MNAPKTTQKRTALLVGATGLVGRHVLDALLADEAYGRTVVLVRRSTGRSHDKLTECVVDFETLSNAPIPSGIDDVFACLGTTIKVAGSQERFRRVDYDYTVQSATLAKQHGARRLGLVSSVGASATSSTFYLRVKGETERDLEALGFESFSVARPSLIVGERQEHRTGESIAMTLSKALSFALVGGLRPYKPIGADVIAHALVDSVLAGEPGTHVLTFDALVRLAARHSQTA